MFSEYSKWVVIRGMITEKYFELRKAIGTVSNNSDDFSKKISKTCKLVREKFLPKNMLDVFADKWIDNLSSVDLLHLYSFLNDVLRCFYYHVPVSLIPLTHNNKIILDYEMHRVGDFELSNNTLFNKFYNNLKMLEYRNKYFSKDEEKSTIIFSGKPKSKNEEKVEFYNEKFRKSVVSFLMLDAVDRFKKTNKIFCGDDFEDIKKEFLINSRILGLDEVKEPEAEEFQSDKITKEFVGLDVNGHPVTKDKDGNYYNCYGEEIYGNIFISKEL